MTIVHFGWGFDSYKLVGILHDSKVPIIKKNLLGERKLSDFFSDQGKVTDILELLAKLCQETFSVLKGGLRISLFGLTGHFCFLWKIVDYILRLDPHVLFSHGTCFSVFFLQWFLFGPPRCFYFLRSEIRTNHQRWLSIRIPFKFLWLQVGVNR